MIEVRNTTAGDLGIGPGLLIPSGGSRVIAPEDYKAALNSGAVQAWLNAGKLIATDLSGHMAPVRAQEAPSVSAGGEPAGEAETEADTRARLIERAGDVGVKVNAKMKTATIARRVAEAEAG